MRRGRGEEGASGGAEGWVGGPDGVEFSLDWREFVCLRVGRGAEMGGEVYV